MIIFVTIKNSTEAIKMIDGITIIEATSVVTDSVLNFMVAYGCFLFITIMCICIGFWRWTVDKVPFKRAKVWIIIGLIGGILIGCLVGKFVLPTPTDYTTIYKVELSDDLDFGEFKQRYKINKQQGMYYYIEEIAKEEEDQ